MLQRLYSTILPSGFFLMYSIHCHRVPVQWEHSAETACYSMLTLHKISLSPTAYPTPTLAPPITVVIVHTSITSSTKISLSPFVFTFSSTNVCTQLQHNSSMTSPTGPDHPQQLINHTTTAHSHVKHRHPCALQPGVFSSFSLFSFLFVY